MTDNIDEINRQKELYLSTSISLIALILKYQANDISKETLFNEVKNMIRPDLYDKMYHKIVTKDFLDISVIDDIDENIIDD